MIRPSSALTSVGGDDPPPLARGSAMILRLQAIDTYYGFVHMLHGVSLEIAPGEVLALLGRNGAGKTTVLKSVMGLVPPRAGGTPDDVFRRFPKLAGAKNRLGGSLSGGEQQMLAIGRAIMTRPSLMLLDEPSQGLAPMVLDSIVEMLRDLKAGGLAMLLVEQNVDTALALADRVII